MRSKLDVVEKLHEELHEGKPCRPGVACRGLATARHLAPAVHRLIAAELAATVLTQRPEK